MLNVAQILELVRALDAKTKSSEVDWRLNQRNVLTVNFAPAIEVQVQMGDGPNPKCNITISSENLQIGSHMASPGDNLYETLKSLCLGTEIRGHSGFPSSHGYAERARARWLWGSNWPNRPLISYAEVRFNDTVSRASINSIGDDCQLSAPHRHYGRGMAPRL